MSQLCEIALPSTDVITTTTDRYADKYAVFNFHNQRDAQLDTHPKARETSAPVKFESVYDFPGWDRAQHWILDIIKRFRSEDVLEVGSGANPTLGAQTVSSQALHYTANDVSATELDKADRVYDRWVSDVATDTVLPSMQGRFDLVFSRMVNEHVSDGAKYHANIHKLLKPGGISAHCFSTLYNLPFTVNRIIPESASRVLLNTFMPREDSKLGKFRAHYSWSRGPSASMLRRFDALGFDVLDYRGYFGHAYYCRIPALHRLEAMKARWLLSHPAAALCSYGMVIARKRSEPAEQN